MIFRAQEARTLGATLGEVSDRAEVAAVHDDEVIAFLDRLGVTDQYSSGSLVCSVCELPLLNEGLGAVREDAEGSLVFACAKLSCMEDFHRPEAVVQNETEVGCV